MKTKKGFIPVMLTPFDTNGDIDYGMLTRLTEFYCESGAAGLFANCLSSEMFDLSPEERLAITSHITGIVNNKIPVVATGNFGTSIADMADFVKRIYNTGVDAVILATSLLAGQNDSEETFIGNTTELMDLTGNIPLGFYECPVPYKRIISPNALDRFLESNRVVYHKDTCLDIDQVRVKLEISKGYDFKLYDAYLVHAVESLRSGSSGLSCIQGNFFPEVITWICENYDQPQHRKKVDRVQDFFIENMDVMHTAYPNVAKYFLQKRGFGIAVYSRSVKGIVEGSILERINKLFDDYCSLKEELDV